MFDKLSKKVTWSTLKTIGGSKFAAAATILPLVGYLLFFSEVTISFIENFEASLRQFIGIENKEKAQDVLDNQKLKMMYIGLWSIGFATLMFRLLCPKTIGDYLNEREYVENSIAVSNKSHFALTIQEIRNEFSCCHQVNSISEARQVEVQNDIRSPSGIARGSKELLRSDWLEKNSDSLSLVYRCKYEKDDLSMLYIRIIIGALYGVGLLTTLVPSANTFMIVVISLFS